jgi:hypothetical protein
MSRDTISAGESTILAGTGKGVVLVGLELLQPHRAAARKLVIATIKREATLALQSFGVAIVSEGSMLCGRISLEVGCYFQQVARAKV